MLFLLITVDTEATHGSNPLQQMIYGDLSEGCFGIDRIMSVCDQFCMKATFFLDVYECSFYGSDAMRSIAQEIHGKGHDVQLHTHPAWWTEDPRDAESIQRMKREHAMYDPLRYLMNHYSLAEQIAIVRHGKALLEAWTGEAVIAHRAGAYGANEDTLKALRANGIPVDSSCFCGHANCKVAFTKNRIEERQGVIELPATIFYKNQQAMWGGYVLRNAPTPIKTDLDWATLSELKFYVQQAKAKGIRMMNLFLHSYSLVKFNDDFTSFAPDWDNLHKFELFLGQMADDPQVRVLTVKDFHALYSQDPEPFQGANTVPAVDIAVGVKPIQWAARRLYRSIGSGVRHLTRA